MVKIVKMATAARPAGKSGSGEQQEMESSNGDGDWEMSAREALAAKAARAAMEVEAAPSRILPADSISSEVSPYAPSSSAAELGSLAI